jgi:hypothetical protein
MVTKKRQKRFSFGVSSANQRVQNSADENENGEISRGPTERIVRVLVYGLVLDIRWVGFGHKMGNFFQGLDRLQMVVSASEWNI